MAESVVLAGVTYTIPDQGDPPNWGTGLTAYLVAIAANIASNPAFMQYVSVAATPTSAVSGKTYLITTSSLAITMNLPSPVQNTWFIFKDVSANAAAHNITLHRFGSEQIDGVSADKVLSRSAGTWIVMSDGTNWWTLNEFPDTGLVASDYAAGSISNVAINAAAAIAYSKLNLSGSIVNSDINASAAIAYSKLNLTGNIVNADINASAAIAYSKLNLGSSIQNTDLVSGVFSRITGLGAQSQALAMGSNKITGGAAGTAGTDFTIFSQISGQRIIQQVTFRSTSLSSGASTSYFDTGFVVTITPTSASSTIKITVTSAVQPSNTSPGSTDIYTSIFRGGVAGTNLGDATKGIIATSLALASPAANQYWIPIAMTIYDSPATTSPVTYKVGIRGSNTTNSVLFNAGQGSGVMIAEEIG